MRKPSNSVTLRNECLLNRIKEIKGELFWLREWKGEAELSKELDKWVEYYNRSYLHSALGYHAPIQAEEEYHGNTDEDLLNAA